MTKGKVKQSVNQPCYKWMTIRVLPGIIFSIFFFLLVMNKARAKDRSLYKSHVHHTNIYLEYAQKTAEWLVSLSRPSKGGLMWPDAEGSSYSGFIGIDQGAAGIGLFFLELYRVINDPEYLKIAEDAGIFLSRHVYTEGEIDWLSGAAGVGEFFLKLWEENGEDLYLDQAKRAGDWLMEKHYGENGGYYWRHSPNFEKIYTGWAHGAAGIGAFFSHLYDVTKEKKYLDCAQKAAKWILSFTWKWNENQYCWPRLTTDTQPNTTWCGGSVGIIMFLLRLYDSTGNDLFFHYAQGGTEWLINQAQPGQQGSFKWSYGPDSTSYPYAYCHGTPSIVHILYVMYKRSNNQKYLTYAAGGSKWLKLNAERIGSNIFRWPHIQNYSHDTGLMTGTAGVGNSFVISYACSHTQSDLSYAKGAAHWLMSVGSYPETNKVKWINYVDEYDKDRGEKLYKTGWYAGAAGIGIFFLNLSQTLHPPPPENNPPVLNPIGDKITLEKKLLEFAVQGYDPDGDPLLFLVGNLPSGAVFAQNQFSWTPDHSQTGDFYLYFIALDGWLGTAQQVKVQVFKGKQAWKRR